MLFRSLSDTYSRSAAFFGTLNYAWKRRYSINGTIRYEGTNKLGMSTKSRWLPTWNVSGAWIVDEEPFFDKQNVLSHAKLRASYSLTADRGPAGVTNSLPVIMSNNPWRPSAGVTESGLYIGDLENSELTYEKKHELSIGAELGFLKDRINVTFDWYRRDNFDLIGVINTTGVGGQVDKYANVASMRSHGVELSVSTQNIVTKDFRWSTDFVYAYAKNTVTDFETNARVIDMITGTGFTIEGYPVRSLFSYDFKGLNESGLPTFINENGILTVSDLNFQDRINKSHLVYEGPTDPTSTGSLANVFSYKGFKLNVFIT